MPILEDPGWESVPFKPPKQCREEPGIGYRGSVNVIFSALSPYRPLYQKKKNFPRIIPWYFCISTFISYCVVCITGTVSLKAESDIFSLESN